MKNSNDLFNSMDISKKKKEKFHNKLLTCYKIDLIKNDNYEKKNKLSPENKSFIFSDYTNSGVTLDQSKINSEKNTKIKRNEKLNINFLNSQEHKIYMKNFIDNINRSISKNRKKKNKSKNNNESNKNELKRNIKYIIQNIQKSSKKKNCISEQLMSNVKKIKSSVINNNKDLKNNSNLNFSSTLISHSSIFNSKPSNSIISSISVSKKESNNNSENVSNLDEVNLTYSDEKSLKRNDILFNHNNYNNNNKNEDFKLFYEIINKKLFGN